VHWNVPFGRNTGFVGRESILERLLSKIPPSSNQHDCQRTAIEGLGGIGKTQIALEAVFQVRDKYPDCHIFWVPAIDITTFENAYREIGRLLGLSGIKEDTGDTCLVVKMGLCELAEDWLLVIDNADDIELLFGPARARPIADYLPSGHRGSILFTSRNHEAVNKLDVAKSGVIRVTDMSRQEASKLLQNQLDPAQIGDSVSLAELLDFLADLPLAIKQAAAYLDKTGMTVRQYLKHCRSGGDDFIRLLSKDFNDRGRYKVVRNPIAATWLVSFEQISRDNELAARYLKIMALVAEKNIPDSLLSSHTNWLEHTEAIGTLKSYAFITQRSGQQSYDMHRLVRLALRKWLAENGELEDCLSAAMRQLIEVCPLPDHETRAIIAAYIPHIMAILKVNCHGQGDSSQREDLLYIAAMANKLTGKYHEAEGLFRELYDLRVQRLGAGHPNIVWTQHNLVTCLTDQGKDAEAEPLYQEIVPQLTMELGAEHPTTLTSMDNLAYNRTKQGKYEEAEEMYREVIQCRVRLFGEDHRDTLFSMHHFGINLEAQRRYKEAQEILEQVIKLRSRVHGIDHPETLRSKIALANVRSQQGNYSDAEMMYRQVLDNQRQFLGTKHPHTLETTTNLGLVVLRQERYEEIEAILKEAVVDIVKVFGPGHSTTLSSMNLLAIAVLAQGREDEAEQIYRQAVGAKPVLGHEKSLHDIRDNLVWLLRKQGRDGEAEQALADVEKLLRA